ncbi:MAG: GNAT family N-acetyltransferase [Candidatus Marinimicrobia bacterium]|nr:GNAT family N-acetyltransferase [Candidatus Neomarinimicrobiota bacterium]
MYKLHTQRLLLRPLRPADADGINKNIRSEAVLEHMRVLSYPYDIRTTLPFVRKAIRDLRNGSQYVFAVCNGSNDTFMGIIALTHIDPRKKCAEVYYWLGQDFWHRGYMPEALNAVRDFAFNTLNLQHIRARVSSANFASIKLLKKSGFILERTLPEARYKYGKSYDELCYGIGRDNK